MNAVKSKPKSLDQFYTNPSYAKHFFQEIISRFDFGSFDWVVEPSAGDGSFFNLLPSNKRIGIDIDPKCGGVLAMDFFHYNYIKHIHENVITIGNPPFGKNSSLAVKFFNTAAKYSNVIAFVLPRTFRKRSVINSLDFFFHCVYDEDVPPGSFIMDGKEYDVPCVAQIWVKKKMGRGIIKKRDVSDARDYFYVVDLRFADFAIQRVGVNAGKIKTDGLDALSPSSHYFLKLVNPKTLEIMKSCDFKSAAKNTVGNPSLSLHELVDVFLREVRI